MARTSTSWRKEIPWIRPWARFAAVGTFPPKQPPCCSLPAGTRVSVTNSGKGVIAWDSQRAVHGDLQALRGSRCTPQRCEKVSQTKAAVQGLDQAAARFKGSPHSCRHVNAEGSGSRPTQSVWALGWPGWRMVSITAGPCLDASKQQDGGWTGMTPELT